MKTLINEKDVLKLVESYDKTDLELKMLIFDYNWTETDEKNFCNIYILGNLEKLTEAMLIASVDGEVWNLEIPFNLVYVFEENMNKYGVFRVELTDKKTFPRAFVVKGIGEEIIYDNNDGRNYMIKKGRGGNIIPKKKKIILLNSIELYSLFDK